MRSAVTTEAAPRAIGPYAQAIAAGNLVFCSGQIPLDPGSGDLITGSIEIETKRVVDNLEAVLAAAGCRLADVVKTTIFLTDMGHFADVNRIYGERFGAAPPARSTIQVAALPKGARVEIEAIAIRANQ
ncbi:MAG: RidA family protein [Deltaproteobacteria bacterium]|nr:RidA family protein [Deltaproteobacteria bacterium]